MPAAPVTPPPHALRSPRYRWLAGLGGVALVVYTLLMAWLGVMPRVLEHAGALTTAERHRATEYVMATLVCFSVAQAFLVTCISLIGLEHLYASTNINVRLSPAGVAYAASASTDGEGTYVTTQTNLFAAAPAGGSGSAGGS